MKDDQTAVLGEREPDADVVVRLRANADGVAANGLASEKNRGLVAVLREAAVDIERLRAMVASLSRQNRSGE